MPCDTLFFVSVPGLRARDLVHMPRLRELASCGAIADLVPTFPCVTSPVQASMLTGRTPQEHGIIGNGFFHRDRGEVELWIGRNGLIQGPQLWNVLAARGISQSAWMTQNIKDAAADFIITPEPRHHPDGRTELWCYAKPEGLYDKLLADIGHFPLMNYWGPLAGIDSSRWIINAALWLFQRERPAFNHVYLPHLDYQAQKFGPDSPQQAQACREADEQLGRLLDGVAALDIEKAAFLVVSEYAMTDVSRVLYPNRVLRDAGLARIESRGDHEYLDVPGSTAFAVVDHQFAHVYVKEAGEIDAAAGLFEGVDGIAEVLVGRDRSRRQVDHPRSGEVVLVCEPDTWLAYYWWHDSAKAPPFARTVDIHAKPGYDPVELFFDPAAGGIPLDASLVRGSHGAPATLADQFGCLVSSGLTPGIGGTPLKDTDISYLVQQYLD